MKRLTSFGVCAAFVMCCFLHVSAGGSYGGGSNLGLQGTVQDNSVCNSGTPNCQCNGKMKSLTVVYMGQNGATVKVYKSSSFTSSNLITSFSNVQNGQTLVVSAASIGGQFQSYTYFVISGGSSNCNNSDQINTSCSSSIIGKTYGSFKVVGYTDGAGSQCSLNVCDGEIDLTVSGGTGPYTYVWSNGSTSQDVVNLCGGTYSVTVKDKNCVSSSKSFTVGQGPSGISVTASSTPTESCPGITSCYNYSNNYSQANCNGTIAITVSGGASPYSYHWSNGKTSKDQTGLCAGTYMVTINDANGCTATQSVTVGEVTTNITLTVSTTPNETCQSITSSCNYYNNYNQVNCNGTIDLTVSGGASPYTYHWSNNKSTQDQTGVCSGNYTVTVTDANGCTAAKSVTVGQTVTNIILTATTTPNVTCQSSSTCGNHTSSCYNSYHNLICNNQHPSNCNGTISLVVSGGTAPYSYNWSNNQTVEDPTGLCSGCYKVTVIDANGCSATKTVCITDITPTINLTAITTPDLSCVPGVNCTGSIDLTVTGATAPYSFLWSNGVTTEDQSGVCAGAYTVTMTDAKGCTKTKNVTVTQITTTATCNISGNAEVCPGSMNIYSGAQSNSYNWTVTGDATIIGANNQSTVTVQAAGNCGEYDLQLSAQQGNCTAVCVYTVEVVDHIAPVISGVRQDTTIECTELPVFSEPTVSDNCGQNVDLTFEDETHEGSCAQSYRVTRTWTATDGCGNTATASQTVNVVDRTPPNVTMSATQENIQCPAQPAFGELMITDNCDPAPTYNYEDDTILGQCANKYTIVRNWTVTDGCGNSSSASQSVTVSDLTPPDIIGIGQDQIIQCPATPQFSDVIATDACGNASLTFVDDTIRGACENEYIIVRSFTAVDDCGNSSSASQAITVIDLNAPVITGIGEDKTVECSDSIMFSEPVASDECGNATLTFHDGFVPGSCANEFILVREWTAVDGCGNSSSASQAITVIDNTPPTINGVGDDETIECPAIPQFGVPTVSDACDLSPELAFVDDTINGGADNNQLCILNFAGLQPGTILSEQYASYGVHISAKAFSPGKNAAIVFDSYTSGSPDTDLEVDAGNLVIIPQNLTDSNHDGIIDIPNDNVNGGKLTFLFDTERTVVSFVFVDKEDEDAYAVAYDHFNNPIDTGVILPLGDASVQTVVMNASGVRKLEFTYVNSGGITDIIFGCDNGCPGYSIRRTWTATDACGNSSTASQTITAIDTTAPVISGVGNDQTVECPAVPQFSHPVATDACDANTTLTFADDTIPGNCANEFVIVRTWTAVDRCGNSSSASQSIAVIDDTPPVISGVDPDKTIGCDVLPQFSEPNVADDCGSATLSHEDDTLFGDAPDTIVFIRTWTATDACGNGSSTSQKITTHNTYHRATGVNPKCSNSCDGEVVASGECYSYLWSTGDTTPSVSNLCAGVYVVTMTDRFGFTVLDTVELTAPLSIVLDTILTHISCFEANDGAVDLIVTGGTIPYYYGWSNGVTTQDISGLLAGSYSVTVTDMQGCTATITTVLKQPSELTLGATSSPVSCHGLDDGEITLTVSGSVPPYSFAWSNGATTQNISGLPGGIYMVTVTDAHHCQATVNTTVDEPEVVVLTAQITKEGCMTGTGAADLSVTGGTEPYTYHWSNGATTQDISGLIHGSYVVTVTDSSGCSAVKTMNVDSSSITMCDISGDAVICPNSIQIYAAASAQTYDWSVSGNALITGSSVHQSISIQATSCGQFSIELTVTGQDCPSTCSHAVDVIDNEPPVISGVGVNNTIECPAMPTFSEPTASDVCSSATLTFEDDTIAGNCLQSFTIVRTFTVTDACGNSSTASQAITVIDTTAPQISGIGENDTIHCPAQPEFSEPVVTDACGNASVSFVDDTIPGSCANEYIVVRSWTAVDDCGNSSSASQAVIVIDDAAPVFSGVGEDETIECPEIPIFSSPIATDECGSVTVSFVDDITFGNCNFNFIITRTWTAEDACGNTSTVSQTITAIDTDAPVFTFVPGDDMMPCPIPQFGQPVVEEACSQFSISYVDDTIFDNAPEFIVFTRSWTAIDGCGNQSETVTQHITTHNVYEPASGVNPSCHYNCDGRVTVSGDCYSYLWSTGDTTSTVENLCEGIYTVTMTDIFGFQLIDTVVLVAPLKIEIQSHLNNVSCFEAGDGSIDLTVSGGTGQYTFNWSNDATTEDIMELVARTYSVTVTDQNGCIATLDQVITQPGELTIGAIPTPASCNGSNDGSITLAVMGSVPPYSFLWSTGDTTQDINGLHAGSYTATVTDAHQCQATVTTEVLAPELLSLSIEASDEHCHGSAGGSVNLAVSGGTLPYTYNWSNGAMTEDISELNEGNYTVTVYDDNGCFASGTAEIQAPTEIGISLSKTNVSCECQGAFQSCDLNYKILHHGDFINNQFAAQGVHIYGRANSHIDTVIVFDSYQTGTPDPDLQVGLGNLFILPHTIKDANHDGRVDVPNDWAGGGKQIYVFDTDCDLTSFIFVDNDQNVVGHATAYDALNNVVATAIIPIIANGAYITVPIPAMHVRRLEIQYAGSGAVTGLKFCDSNHETCCDGTVIATITGGVPPYHYIWVTGDTTHNLDSLCAGVYELTVTDAHGCRKDTFVIVDKDSSCTFDLCFNVNCDDHSACTVDTCISGACIYASVEHSVSIAEVSICNGESYLAGGSFQTVTGIYYDTLLNVNGCDSVLITNLAVTLPLAVTHEHTAVTDTCGHLTNELCLLDFAGLPHGTILTGEEYAAYGIHISWFAYPNTWTNTPNINQLIIFNTFATGTWDHDLQVGIGNIAIFPENLTDADSNSLVDIPNDTRWGGQEIYSFDYERTVLSVTIVDHDKAGGSIIAYDQFNNVIVTVPIPTMADGSVAVIPVNAAGVRKLVIDDMDSGGTSDIRFECDSVCCNATAEIFVNGGTSPYSYLWSSGDTTASVRALCEGTYYVTITDANGCSQLDSVVIGVNQQFQLKLIEKSFEDLIAYPVPFNDQLFVEYNAREAGEVTFTLYNMLGQSVFNTEATASKGANKTTLDLGSITADGMYILELNKNNYKEYIKVNKNY